MVGLKIDYLPADHVFGDNGNNEKVPGGEGKYFTANISPILHVFMRLLPKSQLNRNTLFLYSKMTAENNDSHSIFVKYASRETSKVLFVLTSTID